MTDYELVDCVSWECHTTPDREVEYEILVVEVCVRVLMVTGGDVWFTKVNGPRRDVFDTHTLIPTPNYFNCSRSCV